MADLADAPFIETVRKKYRRYATHVLGFRHFAEGRDGQKPVNRRAIWAMHQMGAVDSAHMAATSKVSGDTMGNFHPHDSKSIDSAIAGMSQASTDSPTIIGVGNFGSFDSKAAAPRYTKVYLSPYARTMLDHSEMTCVPMDPTYSGKGVEPRFLPVRLPHLLIVGCESIAPGVKGNIPPCPAEWVAEAVGLITRKQSARIKLPDGLAYRWGGRLLSMDQEWLSTGTGSAVLRPELKIENGCVVFTTLAPGLYMDSLESALEKHPGYGGMAKETAPHGSRVRIVVRVRRGTNPRDLAILARDTIRARTHFSFLHISQKSGDDGEVAFDPVIEGPIKFLQRWVAWRRRIVSGAAEFRADKLRSEVARIDLLLRAVDKKKELVNALDAAKSRDDLHQRVKKILRCSDEEAQVIREIQFQRLAFLEAGPMKARRAEATRLASLEDEISARPDGRMLTNANDTLDAIIETRRIAEAARSSKQATAIKGRKRGRK